MHVDVWWTRKQWILNNTSQFKRMSERKLNLALLKNASFYPAALMVRSSKLKQ